MTAPQTLTVEQIENLRFVLTGSGYATNENIRKLCDIALASVRDAEPVNAVPLTDQRKEAILLEAKKNLFAQALQAIIDFPVTHANNMEMKLIAIRALEGKGWPVQPPEPGWISVDELRVFPDRRSNL